MFHSLLKRQLKRNELNPEIPPTSEQWQGFLDRIDRTYLDTDQERYLLERSLMISSAEMQEVYGKLHESENRYALAAKGANDGLWDWDLITESAYYSQRWVEIMGIRPEAGQKPCKECWLERIHPEDYEKVVSELDSHLEGKTKHFQNEHRVLHQNGEYRWVLSRGLAVRDSEGKACRIAGSLTDITERKLAAQKMEHDAVHDALTGLPNRKSLMKRLDRTLKRAKHDKDFSFAVLFMDLDRFKIVNDSLGHQSGDVLLLEIAKKLELLVRPGDMVARLGGDEFVLLVENISRKDDVVEIAERILKQLQQPVTISNQEIYSSGSIGVVFGSSEYDKPDDIVRDADLAMYRAKEKGKGRFELFDSQFHSGTISRLQLEIDLRQAIERQEFVLHYQPIVSLISEEIIGFESLIRWEHPIRGLVPPNDFIPVAEETGMILPIGNWVVLESCFQMKEWQELNPTAKDLVININISARQLEQKDLVKQIEYALIASELEPSCLKLEITESVIMENADQAISKVNQFREMGVRVSIDDFGTGYSSLSYLHRFPIDTLKVDRSFISRIGEEGEGAEIVQTIIALASTLGMDVVAEGIETSEQSKFLQQVNCSHGQGFFYSRPVDNDAVSEMLRNIPDRKGMINPALESNENVLNDFFF